jgi:hypothetical protein
MYVRTSDPTPALVLALALAGATAAIGALAVADVRAREAAGVAPPALRPDLNSSPARHLILLPGIGPVRAGAIVEDRERLGPFRSIGDLSRVRGIGPATSAALMGIAGVSGRPSGASDPIRADPALHWAAALASCGLTHVRPPCRAQGPSLTRASGRSPDGLPSEAGKASCPSTAEDP